MNVKRDIRSRGLNVHSAEMKILFKKINPSYKSYKSYVQSANALLYTVYIVHILHNVEKFRDTSWKNLSKNLVV